jgi:hypothetical protein
MSLGGLLNMEKKEIYKQGVEDEKDEIARKKEANQLLRLGQRCLLGNLPLL